MLAFNTFFAVTLYGSMFLLLQLWPVAYVWSISEDNWAENLSAGGWLVAGLVVLLTLYQRRDLRRPALLAFGVLALVVGMEEISWGQRFLDLRSPELFRAHNLQQEINLHNLTTWPEHEVASLGLAAWLLIVTPAIGRMHRVRAWSERWGFLAAPPPVIPFVALAIVTLWFRPTPKGDEWGEAFLGLVVALTAVFFWLQSRPPLRFESGTVGAMAAMSLMVLAAAGSRLPGAEARFAWRLNDFASLRLSDWGYPEQARVLFEYLDQHPAYRAPEAPLDHARLLRRLGDSAAATARLEAALREYADSLGNEPGNTRFRRASGEAWRLLGNHDASVREFRIAEELDLARLHQAPSPNEQGLVYLSLARTRQAAGDSAGAATYVRRGLALPVGPAIRTRLEAQLSAP